MESVRNSFVTRFGEDQATKLEAAANEHKNGIHDRTGSDPFKWALTICIGYECFTREGFREYHGITVPVEELKQWIRAEGQLDSHDGDCDFVALFCGVYNEYMPDKVEQS